MVPAAILVREKAAPARVSVLRSGQLPGSRLAQWLQTRRSRWWLHAIQLRSDRPTRRWREQRGHRSGQHAPPGWRSQHAYGLVELRWAHAECEADRGTQNLY